MKEAYVKLECILRLPDKDILPKTLKEDFKRRL